MDLKTVTWLGNSKWIIGEFPEPVRVDLGFQLYRLQMGKPPTKSRPMKSIGKSVFELKEQDSNGWYRVIYTLAADDRLIVLHCFMKTSSKTEKHDIALARNRLRTIRGQI